MTRPPRPVPGRSRGSALAWVSLGYVSRGASGDRESIVSVSLCRDKGICQSPRAPHPPQASCWRILALHPSLPPQPRIDERLERHHSLYELDRDILTNLISVVGDDVALSPTTIEVGDHLGCLRPERDARGEECQLMVTEPGLHSVSGRQHRCCCEFECGDVGQLEPAFGREPRQRRVMERSLCGPSLCFDLGALGPVSLDPPFLEPDAPGHVRFPRRTACRR